MPKTKGPRNASKQNASTSSRATELGEVPEEGVEDPQSASKSEILEKFEMEFAFKLKLFDKLLEEKLAALNGMKERMKIKYSAFLGCTLEQIGMEFTDDKENVNVMQISSHGKHPQAENEVSSLQGLHGKRLTRSKHKNKNQLEVPYAGNAFQTPITTGFPNVPVVTPKVAMNTPISMLRLPRQGELALSLSGSPVMVTAMSHESKPNINIALNGEQVLSMIPHERFDPNSLPDLDEEAVEQIEALKRNLLAFINITSSNSA